MLTSISLISRTALTGCASPSKRNKKIEYVSNVCVAPYLNYHQHCAFFNLIGHPIMYINIYRVDMWMLFFKVFLNLPRLSKFFIYVIVSSGKLQWNWKKLGSATPVKIRCNRSIARFIYVRHTMTNIAKPNIWVQQIIVQYKTLSVVYERLFTTPCYRYITSVTILEC